MEKKNKLYYILLLIAILVSYTSIAQENQEVKTKKIGLVLSGGGAKGLAHIGALKVIDSLGIKVDYIAGTSMGAIIGALYASGYTGKQLDSIYQVTNFETLISDDIPRSSRSYFERQQAERYALTLPFKNFKVSLPSSLSKGQNVYNFLSKLLIHVKDIHDFEKLPIPFFCIATDIVTGEEVLLNSGNLASAVNASGALPSLFAPVKLNERLLIDGGVTNNYPVEELRARGIDFIIGVDVQDDLKTNEEINGALDILAQINNFATIKAMREKKQHTDIYINPNIAAFNVVSFNSGNDIIKSGQIASQNKINALMRIATPNYSKPKLKHTALNDTFHITAISINGNDNFSRAYVRGRFNFKIQDTVSYNHINEGINKLQATTNFTKINHEIVSTQNDSRLDIEVVENPVRNYLRFGIHYDELLRSAALVNFTRKKALVDNDVLSADVILGDNVRYNLDYYIDKGNYWSVGFHSEFVQFEKQIDAAFAADLSNMDLSVNNIDVNYNDWTQQLYLQTRLANDVTLTAGVELKKLRIFTRTLLTESPDDNRTIFENNATGSIYSSALYDSYDNLYFPKKGWRVSGDFHLYLLSTDLNQDFNEFSIAQVSLGKAFPINNKVTLRGEILVGTPIGDPANSSFDFFLGGYGARHINNILPFYGYDFISLGGNSVLKSLLELDWELIKKNHLTFSANIANVDDDLFQQNDWFSQARYTGYAIGYGLETFLGPVELKYSFTPQQNASEFYVNLGFSF